MFPIQPTPWYQTLFREALAKWYYVWQLRVWRDQTVKTMKTGWHAEHWKYIEYIVIIQSAYIVSIIYIYTYIYIEVGFQHLNGMPEFSIHAGSTFPKQNPIRWHAVQAVPRMWADPEDEVRAKPCRGYSTFIFFHSALFRCFMHIQFFIRHVTSLQALEPQGLSGWRVCRIAWMGLLAIVHNTQFIPENWLTSTLLCGRVVVSCPKAICLTMFDMFCYVRLSLQARSPYQLWGYVDEEALRRAAWMTAICSGHRMWGSDQSPHPH